jgi:type IVB pilus formation R64 PilN family outer membrane protein
MRSLAVALAITLLAGCTSSATRQSLQEIQDAKAQVDGALAALRSGQQERDGGGIKIIDDQMYVPQEAVELKTEKLLPVGCKITFAPTAGATLQAFSQHVVKICGIPVRVTPDALTALSGGNTASSNNTAGSSGSVASSFSAAGLPLPSSVSLPPPVSGVINSMPVASSAGNNLIDVRYSGDLAGLLDAVTARLGLSWRYQNGAIQVFYTETRFYKLYALPKAQTIKSTTSSGSSMTVGASATGVGGSTTTSSGGTDSSTSSITTSDDISIDPSKDVREALQSLLTPQVGRMAFAPSTGTITVTDTPERLQIIEDWVTAENNFRTKFVLLNVELITVKLTNSSELGVDWNLAYQNIAKNYGLGLASSFATATEAVAGSINILESSSRFSGSQAVIKALQQQGEIVNKRTPSTSTLNMKPVSVQLGTQTGYIMQSSATSTADVGVTSSLTPGQVTAGFNMTLMPFIQPDNKTVLLSLAINITDLIELERKEVGQTAVETPNLSKQILNQEVRIQSGQTLVLSGLDTVSLQDTRAGVGSSRFFLFGGGKKTSRDREVLIALVTPIVKG